MSGQAAKNEYLGEIQATSSVTTYSEARTLREYTSSLNIDRTPQVVRGTGIVCTIGPSCQSVEKLKDLIANGLNIARLNFSHGTHEYHKQTIDNVREAAKSAFPHPIAIALDTKGPEIRTGNMKNGGTTSYTKGQKLKVSCDPAFADQCDENQQFLHYPSLVQSIKVGSEIVIADGNFLLKVTEIVDDRNIVTEVLNNTTIGSRKNCNLPGAVIDLPAVSEKDAGDLKFAADNELDMVFASFIRKKADVLAVRTALGEKGKHIKIISKIENHEGIVNIDEILQVTDGVMVARGDMGMEIPLEKVFIAQKMIISRCRAAGKPVICATQMLESMITNPRPTRAEITDVGNAVTDGADCVMLSGETASGAYPVESVNIMHKICRTAQSCVFHRYTYDEMKNCSDWTDPTEATAVAVVGASFKVNASAIVVLTTSGRSARLLSHYSPKCPILLVTRNAHTARCGHLYRNIFPLEYTEERKEKWTDDKDVRLQYAIRVGRNMGFIKNGSYVIFVCGWAPGSATTNSMRILEVKGEDVVGTANEYTFPQPMEG